MLKITAEEVNFIIYQFLHESGKYLDLLGPARLLVIQPQKWFWNHLKEAENKATCIQIEKKALHLVSRGSPVLV